MAVDKGVVQIGGVVQKGLTVRAVKESFFEPVAGADGIEGEGDLIKKPLGEQPRSRSSTSSKSSGKNSVASSIQTQVSLPPAQEMDLSFSLSRPSFIPLNRISLPVETHRRPSGSLRLIHTLLHPGPQMRRMAERSSG